MKDANKVAVAAAFRMIAEGIEILKAAGISGKGINILLIGLAGIKKEIRKENKNEHVAGI